MPQQYPFSAVVGSEDMRLALVLTTISPEVGGVLVRGEKGTAKSTVVRALAGVLPPIRVIAEDRFSSDPDEKEPLSPDGPFPADVAVRTRPVRLVELPVGATEDRVLGSLHLERALREGRAEYEPGLLAAAHRGILYVDEVNLLHDHLVDLLLDAAAMGRATVERDGVSVTHAARFVLVGTMNPEEGELRPQLLDRFGLTVEVAASRDPEVRVEVVRRRMAFDADPERFVAAYAEDEAALTDRIRHAQEALGAVVLGDEALRSIAEVCAAFGVDGMRADIVTARTAIAHAAWNGRTEVTRADIRAAARLALPHRRRRNPFDAPGLDEDLLDRVLAEGDPPPDPDPDRPDPGQPETEGTKSADTSQGSDPEQGTARAGASAPAEPAAEPTGQATGQATDVAPATPFRARLLAASSLGAGEAGKRSRAITSNGRRIGARAGGPGALHLVETIRAAAPHQGARPRAGAALVLRPEDLRIAVREGRETNLVLFCVDASGSMAARSRMEPVKTAILSLLLDAYRRRDKVGLVTFRGDAGTLTLPPTSSVDIAAARLAELPAGGRTPLAEGLAAAAETLRVERIRDPRRRALLVVLTDGRATSGSDAVARAHRIARGIAATHVHAVVVDCETGRLRLGLGRELADHLAAEHLPLGEVAAGNLTELVRERGAA